MSRMEDGLSIADVAERTGIAIATLRAWEARYGFPEPQRLPSGHRRFDEHVCDVLRDVVRLRADGLSMEAAIARARRNARGPEPSIYAAIRGAAPDLAATLMPARALVNVSHAIEDECLARGSRCVVFGAF